ncbi:MAG TPA: hypothetical protein VFE65_01835 [Pseudonocardia sp.]|jgi:hypothetical protein|nr:hypothetical protein [Pseudonocardia sp.]
MSPGPVSSCATIRVDASRGPDTPDTALAAGAARPLSRSNGSGDPL